MNFSFILNKRSSLFLRPECGALHPQKAQVVMYWIKKIMTLALLSIGATVAMICAPIDLWSAANGGVSGTLHDPSGAVVSGAKITLVNTALKTEYKTISNGQGFYSFPTLPVGHYDLTIKAAGFKTRDENELGGRYRCGAQD